VCVERFDEKLLVSYRDMYIREIDPVRGKTQALVAPRVALPSKTERNFHV
jgi:hypothetical protein